MKFLSFLSILIGYVASCQPIFGVSDSSFIHNLRSPKESLDCLEIVSPPISVSKTNFIAACSDFSKTSCSYVSQDFLADKTKSFCQANHFLRKTDSLKSPAPARKNSTMLALANDMAPHANAQLSPEEIQDTAMAESVKTAGPQISAKENQNVIIENSYPVSVAFIEPVAHGTNIVGTLNPPDILLRLTLNPNSGLNPSHLKAKTQIFEYNVPDYAPDPNDTREYTNWQNYVMEISVPTNKMSLGTNRLVLSIININTGVEIQRQEWLIEKSTWLNLDVLVPSPVGLFGASSTKPRGMICRISAIIPPGSTAENYEVKLELITTGGQSTNAPVQTYSLVAGQSKMVRFDMPSVPVGTYYLKATMTREGSSAILDHSLRLISVVDRQNRPNNATDVLPNGLLLVNGQMTFPLGIYMISGINRITPPSEPWDWSWEHKNPSYYIPALNTIKSSPIKFIIDYSLTAGGLSETTTFLNAVNQRGLKIIYNINYGPPNHFLWDVLMPQTPWNTKESLIRGVLQTYYSHPAVAAIYLNDEGFGPSILPFYETIRLWAREEDPWHPQFSVQYAYFNSKEYARPTDAYGTDPYAIMTDMVACALSWRAAKQACSPGQPMWAVVQTFGPGYENSDPSNTAEPTYDEMRCASFCAVAEGATGIIYYNLHSMQRSPNFSTRWQQLSSIAGEIRDLTPIIALPTPESGVRILQGQVSFLPKRGDGKYYAIIANLLRNQQTIRIEWPAGVTQVRDYKTGNDMPLTGRTTQFQMPALGATVLEATVP